MNLKALFLVLIIALAADAITGFSSTLAQSPAIAGCNNPPSLMQCGTTSCTLSASGSPPYFCSVTVNFSPAFATVPSYVSAQWNGCQNGICHYEEFESTPIASLAVQSDNGETWLNMPAAKTEIYGTTNHEMSILMPNGVNAAYFNVLCMTGSSSGNAVLRPEYSLDGGNTWIELATNTGFLDADVSANNCGFSATGVLPISVGPSGIPPSLAAMSTEFRVVGINGGGVGDNTVFNNIQIILAIKFSNPITTCISGISLACAAGGTLTKSSMIITVTSWSFPGIWIEGINWVAIQ